jgi:predicted phosphate transport protein (TIGR00153 family)
MRLLPHDASFFAHFEHQGKKTVEGCRAFLDMVENPTGLEARADRVKQIEHECDEITHAVVESLHKTFITPIDRNDIYTLITKMDDIMDFVEAAADRLALYEIPKMTKEVGDLARCLVSSAEHVLGAVSSIRDLGKPNGILQHCIEINRLENVADGILRSALARLFREEKDPIAVIKWKEIYETLESATDRCEDVANIIEGVVLENS